MTSFSSSWHWLTDEAHTLAVSKGWWDQERSFYECMGLVISELGEAVEAFRTPGCSSKILAHSHAAEELADVVIRMADLCKHFDLDIAASSHIDDIGHLFDACGMGNPDDNFVCCIDVLMDLGEGPSKYNPVELVAFITAELGDAVSTYPYLVDVEEALAGALIQICQLAHDEGIELGEAILAKHAYNASRPFRHGARRF